MVRRIGSDYEDIGNVVCVYDNRERRRDEEKEVGKWVEKSWRKEYFKEVERSWGL